MTEHLTASTVYEWFFDIMEKERRIYRPNYVHVSELTQCLRRSYYNRTRVERRIDVRNIILTIGNGVHRALQEHLAETKGWSVEVELKMRLGEFWLVGHADLVTSHGNIIELKTTSKIPDKPYRNHLMQLNAYLYMGKANKGWIIYIDKSKGLVKIFEHHRDRALWEELKRRAYEYWKHLKERKLPRPEPSKLCDFCEWKWLCYTRRKRGGNE